MKVTGGSVASGPCWKSARPRWPIIEPLAGVDGSRLRGRPDLGVPLSRNAIASNALQALHRVRVTPRATCVTTRSGRRSDGIKGRRSGRRRASGGRPDSRSLRSVPDDAARRSVPAIAAVLRSLQLDRRRPPAGRALLPVDARHRPGVSRHRRWLGRLAPVLERCDRAGHRRLPRVEQGEERSLLQPARLRGHPRACDSWRRSVNVADVAGAPLWRDRCSSHRRDRGRGGVAASGATRCAAARRSNASTRSR